MLCSKCGTPLLNRSCPSCSDKAVSSFGTVSGGAVLFETPGPSSQRETVALWQQELKRRLAARTEAKPDPDPARAESLHEPSAEGVGPEKSTNPFSYRMKTPEGVAFPRPVSVKPPTLTRKTLVRASRPAARVENSGQRTLQLESPVVEPDDVAWASDSGEVVNREILFSRFLCGIIDVSLPVLTGFLFTIAGAWILDFDYFLSAALEWAGVVSLFFFFFNSFFFLLLLGQTPGMYVTELRLVSDREEGLTVVQVILRVLLFLPSALTLVGLAWGLHDPLCRTAHDRLSATRVQPVEQAGPGLPS